MIRFYFQYFIALMKWHLRMSRFKPGKWRHRPIWWTEMTSHQDRWIWKKERRDTFYRVTKTPGNISFDYKNPNPAEGNGDYFVSIPKGLKIKGLDDKK